MNQCFLVVAHRMEIPVVAYYHAPVYLQLVG